MGWDFDNNKPIYLQIVEEIKNMILSGTIKPGDQVPAVRDMAKNAGVNPNTMQRAFSELERMGLIYADRTAGRYVKDDKEVIADIRKKRVQEIADEICSKCEDIQLNEEEISYIISRIRRKDGK